MFGNNVTAAPTNSSAQNATTPRFSPAGGNQLNAAFTLVPSFPLNVTVVGKTVQAVVQKISGWQVANNSKLIPVGTNMTLFVISILNGMDTPVCNVTLQHMVNNSTVRKQPASSINSSLSATLSNVEITNRR